MQQNSTQGSHQENPDFSSFKNLSSQQPFRITDIQEESSNYNVENMVSFGDISKSQNADLTFSTFSQRTEMKALQNKQEESLLKPVTFNVLVVGQCGTGKTTFIDTLLEQSCFTDKQTTVIQQSLKLVETQAQLCHRNLKVHLTLTDVEGYKSHTQVREWVKQVKKHISTQVQNSKDEFRVHQTKRKALYTSKDMFQKEHRNMTDDRPHSCLYFINGPRLANEDLFALKNLSRIVNVIPILAKGDSYTTEEQLAMKVLIRKSLADHKIECFDCLKCLPENSKYRAWLIKNEAPPFVVVSYQTQEGKQGRVYPWGVCEVWNPEHSDLQTLQKLLIGHYSLDMIALTDYFQYRYMNRKHQKKIKKQNVDDTENPLTSVVKFVLSNVFRLFN